MQALLLRLRLLLACLAGIALFTTVTTAQDIRGTVQGTVTDASGAIVPAATATLRNTETGVTTVRQSDATGRYLFELVDPGFYTLSVQAPGFTKTEHDRFQVVTHGNVTLDTALKLGESTQTVEVSSEATGVDFASAHDQTVLDQKLVNDLPNFGRNPFLLALTDPNIEDARPQNNLPFNSWGSNALQIAGSPTFSSDLQIDGAPITLGLKSSYVPNTTSVHEVTIEKNAVDAEYGNSGGASVAITLNSGTNHWHGTTWFTGRYPWADALEDRHAAAFRTPGTGVNQNRQNMWGADLGNPILKNKLFNYFSYEEWRDIQPGQLWATLPTDLERQGNFSQSKNADGTPVTIYDPFSTKTVNNPDGTQTITRSPFPNNTIPVSMLDPVAMKYINGLGPWKPNRTPDDPSGTNNYFANAPNNTSYRNLTERADYYFSDKLRFDGRWSRFTAPQLPTNPTGSGVSFTNGGNNEGTNLAFNATYTLSANTIFDAHGDWHSLVDEFLGVSGSSQGIGNIDSIWAGQDWTKLVDYPGTFLNKQPPYINVDGKLMFGGTSGYWYSHPEGESIRAKMLHTMGEHTMKAGVEYRYQYGRSITISPGGFKFYQNATQDVYNTSKNPVTGQSAGPNPDTGDSYASMLIGALTDQWTCSWCGTSYMQQATINTPISRFWSVFYNDDWKATKNLTLTFGLRWEYELPWQDSQYRASRGLDLTETNPTLAANPVQISAATEALLQSFDPTLKQNLTAGVWRFTDKNHPGMWNKLGTVFLPRFGLAYRINDKTAFTAAYARWAHPWVQQNYGNTGSLLDVNYPAYNTLQGPAAPVLGVPQVKLADPFPASSPLIPALGKGYGADWGLGDGGGSFGGSITNLEYNDPNRQKDTSDRVNVGIQRQLPFQTVLSATYLGSFSHLSYTYNPNMINPAVLYKFQSALNVNVANPFYNYGTPTTFPGPLRNQQTIPLTQLLRPYPQYGDISQDWTPGGGSQYHSLDLELKRPFSKGLSMLLGYSYHYEKDRIFFTDLAQYNNDWTWQDSPNSRHHLSLAATYDLPVGRNRQFFSGMPRLLDAVIGGWNLAGISTWTSGAYLTFGQFIVTGDPRQNVPSGDYFNPAVFQPVSSSTLPYNLRTNPIQYSGLQGPDWFSLDATLAKETSIREGTKIKIFMTAYNALNRFQPAYPDTQNISDPNSFAHSQSHGYQAGNTFGRQVDLGARITF